MKAIIEHGNVITIEFTNRVIHKDDIITLEKLIDSVRTNFNHANILILITQLETVSLKACLESCKMLIENRKDINKIAVVSNKEIYNIGTKIDNLFTPWKEQYFDISDINDAWDWVKH